MNVRSAKFDYAAEFGTDYHGARTIPHEAEGWIEAVRAEKVQRQIKATDRVLEYGVGFGWNLAAVRCAEKVGFDVTPALGDSVKAKGIRFISNDVALDANHFDVVLCHHVLEHVSRPLASLQRIKELLRTGGKLLLFVPFERESRFRRYRADNRAHHLYSWTRKSLEKLVSTAGFEILSMELQKFRFDRAAAIIAKRLFGGLRLYRFLRSTGMVLAPEYEISMVASTAERGT